MGLIPKDSSKHNRVLEYTKKRQLNASDRLEDMLMYAVKIWTRYHFLKLPTTIIIKLIQSWQ